MKIKPTEEQIDFVMPDDVPEEALQNQVSATKNKAGVSESTGVVVDEVVTPSGKDAIAFTSPVSGIRVVLLMPDTDELLTIERDIVRKHRDSGAFEQSLVFLSHLIVEYGDQKGIRLFNFEKIKKLGRKELTAINVIANEFFGLVKYDFDDDQFYYAGVEFDEKQIKKAILSSVGGQYTETYFKMLKIPVIKLFEMLDLFVEYQQEQERLMKSK
ncbi:tail assembly chaperone [Anabaena phage Elbi]|nr:tail assembly chaperone [Anabaena phage Elbi]